MYKIIRPGVTDYCWNFDENSGEIFRIAADKKIAINFTKSQRLLLKKLITSELLMVSYDALLAASHCLGGWSRQSLTDTVHWN